MAFPESGGLSQEAPQEESKEEAPKAESKEEVPQEESKEEAHQEESKEKAPQVETKAEAPKAETKAEAPQVESAEELEAAKEVDQATFEPEARVEAVGNYETAEAVETAFVETMEAADTVLAAAVPESSAEAETGSSEQAESPETVDESDPGADKNPVEPSAVEGNSSAIDDSIEPTTHPIDAATEHIKSAADIVDDQTEVVIGATEDLISANDTLDTVNDALTDDVPPLTKPSTSQSEAKPDVIRDSNDVHIPDSGEDVMIGTWPTPDKPPEMAQAQELVNQPEDVATETSGTSKTPGTTVVRGDVRQSADPTPEAIIDSNDSPGAAGSEVLIDTVPLPEDPSASLSGPDSVAIIDSNDSSGAAGSDVMIDTVPLPEQPIASFSGDDPVADWGSASDLLQEFLKLGVADPQDETRDSILDEYESIGHEAVTENTPEADPENIEETLQIVQDDITMLQDFIQGNDRNGFESITFHIPIQDADGTYHIQTMTLPMNNANAMNLLVQLQVQAAQMVAEIVGLQN